MFVDGEWHVGLEVILGCQAWQAASGDFCSNPTHGNSGAVSLAKMLRHYRRSASLWTATAGWVCPGSDFTGLHG